MRNCLDRKERREWGNSTPVKGNNMNLDKKLERTIWYLGIFITKCPIPVGYI